MANNVVPTRDELSRQMAEESADVLRRIRDDDRHCVEAMREAYETRRREILVSWVLVEAGDHAEIERQLDIYREKLAQDRTEVEGMCPGCTDTSCPFEDLFNLISRRKIEEKRDEITSTRLVALRQRELFDVYVTSRITEWTTKSKDVVEDFEQKLHAFDRDAVDRFHTSVRTGDILLAMALRNVTAEQYEILIETNRKAQLEAYTTLREGKRIKCEEAFQKNSKSNRTCLERIRKMSGPAMERQITDD